MNELLFPGAEQIGVKAIHVGQRLDLQAFQNNVRLSDSPLTLPAGESGMAVLFRYGVLVTIGLQPAEIQSLLESVRGAVAEPFADPQSDEVTVVRDTVNPEGAAQGTIRVQAFTLVRLQIIADALAKSVVLAHYEVGLSAQFDRIEPLAASFSGKRLGAKAKVLLSHIGETLVIEGKMIGRVQATEKPELIWDYPEHERLFLRLEDEYELAERHVGIERKLALISRTAETALSILQNQRTLRVEWYIVVLIVIEIFIALFEKLGGA